MSQEHRRSRLLKIVRVGALIVLAGFPLFACRPTAETPDGARPAPGPATPETHAAGGSPHLRMALPSYMTGDGPGQFRRLVDSLFFGGVGTGRPPGTTGPTLTIAAMSEANTLGPGDMGDDGTVVARLNNIGTAADPTFGMQPAPGREYYLIAFRGNEERMGTFVLVVYNRANNTLQFARRQGNQEVRGDYVACETTRRRHAHSHANFMGCAENQPQTRTSLSDRIRNLVLPAEAWAGTQPRRTGWVACDFGCCELQLT